MPRAVLLDLTPLVTPSTLRGIGRYVRGLSEGLTEVGAQSDLELQGLVADSNVSRLDLLQDIAAYAQEPAIMPRRRALKRRNRLICLGAPRLARRVGGLLHFTDPAGFPLSGRAGHCLTCHDLIPIALPEYGPPIPGMSRAKLAFERLRYQRARRILAVSHATKRDLCERLQISPTQVDVVWHGVNHRVFHPTPAAGELERVQGALGDRRPYVLYVGAGDLRKDLTTLVSAFAQSRLSREGVLAIAGQMPPERVTSLRAQVAALGMIERVKLLGYVEEGLVPALYRNAAVNVFPSRYEGFGFPVLEALAAGCPTITSPNSSLDEVAGDAAVIIPCGDPDALAGALERVVYDSEQRKSLRERGFARAATFTWTACAEQTLAFWRRALSA